ncbi:unnamed protein product [Sphagnum jensenii]
MYLQPGFGQRSVSKLGSEYIPEILVVTPWVFDATNEGVRSSGSSYAEPSKKMFGVLVECFRKLLAKFLADDSLPILHSTCHHQVAYLDKGDINAIQFVSYENFLTFLSPGMHGSSPNVN